MARVCVYYGARTHIYSRNCANANAWCVRNCANAASLFFVSHRCKHVDACITENVLHSFIRASTRKQSTSKCALQNIIIIWLFISFQKLHSISPNPNSKNKIKIINMDYVVVYLTEVRKKVIVPENYINGYNQDFLRHLKNKGNNASRNHLIFWSNEIVEGAFYPEPDKKANELKIFPPEKNGWYIGRTLYFTGKNWVI